MKDCCLLCLALGITCGLLVSRTGAAADPSGGADAEEQHLQGVVVASQARRTADGTRIVTESTIEQPDGTRLTVTQRGGEVEGFGMFVHDAAPLLRRDDRVELRARASRTSRGEPAWTVSLVSRLERPRPSDPQGLRLLHARELTKETQEPMRWASGCIYVTLDAAGTSHVAGNRELSVMESCFANWIEATESCSYMRFVMEAPRRIEVGLDRKNIVKFRERRWCTPALEDAPEECHDPGTIGLTTTSYVPDPESSRYAEIVDSDIELNAVYWNFGVEGETLGTAPRCQMDLSAVLTHEIGHLLGLAHSCQMANDDSNLVDQEGRPLQPCQPRSALPEEIRESTMAGEASCRDASQASLETDDINGICALFPLESSPGHCRAPAPLEYDSGGCGCQVPKEAGSGPRFLLLGGLVLGSLARRQGRRHRTQQS